MQTRNEISEDITRRYAERSILIDEIKPAAPGIRALATLAAWLIPGAGHLVLGRYGRAVLFFVIITGSFALGLALHGHLYWPTLAEPQSSFFRYDLITVLWFFAQIGSGLCYIVPYLLGLGATPIAEAATFPTFEYGNTFMFLAGLLNYLVIHDAFDIAAGRKR